MVDRVVAQTILYSVFIILFSLLISYLYFVKYKEDIEGE